jgi:hypothetical protein
MPGSIELPLLPEQAVTLGERKTITQLIRVVAHRSESCLASIVEPFFARHDVTDSQTKGRTFDPIYSTRTLCGSRGSGVLEEHRGGPRRDGSFSGVLGSAPARRFTRTVYAPIAANSGQ